MDPAIVMCKNSGHGDDGEKIMELGTMDMDVSATEKIDNGDDGREGDEETRLKIKVDWDAEDALSKLLQTGTVAEYETRFTKARFEDKRYTIAIAKPNDLNTGMHVQDLELEMKVLVDGKQDDAKVVGVAGHQNSDEPNVLKGNGVTGVGVNKNNKWLYKEVQYSVYTLHVLIPFFKRLNDKYIKKKKMKVAIQRRLWDPGIKSFQDNTLRATWF
ncbi:hypothetical protein Tco_0696725 [Tanacetum coccineum]